MEPTLGADCCSQVTLAQADGSCCEMHQVLCGLKNICGEDFLEEVASRVDLGSVCTTERLSMGRNALMDLICALHDNS